MHQQGSAYGPLEGSCVEQGEGRGRCRESDATVRPDASEAEANDDEQLAEILTVFSGIGPRCRAATPVEDSVADAR